MRRVSEVEVARAISLIENGFRIRQVARMFHRSPSVIQRLWNRYRETGQYKRRIGQGRKRKTTAIQDRFLVLSSLRNRIRTVNDLQCALRATHRVDISDQTVRNRILIGNFDIGLKCYSPTSRDSVLHVVMVEYVFTDVLVNGNLPLQYEKLKDSVGAL